MPETRRVRSVLLASAGMGIDGGIACVARCIAAALDEAVRDGRADRVDRVLLHDREPTPQPPARGEERWASGSKLRFSWQLWRAFARQAHDLVLFDVYGPARVLGLPLPGFRPARCAVFTHAFELRLGLDGLRGKVLARATHLLANSDFSAGYLRQRLPSTAATIRTVHLCIDPERTRRWEAAGVPDPTAPREPAVLIVARMARADRGRKGHDALLRAWPRVLEAVPRARLWIAGRGDDARRLVALAQQTGIAERVRFLGQVDANELTRLYRRAAVYAMPSSQEGFGLVFAEAMWHGLPCVGTTADAAGEVIADGATGLLVPFDDVEALAHALRSLLLDADTRIRLGTAGFHRVRREFSYRAFARCLCEALDIASAGTRPWVRTDRSGPDFGQKQLVRRRDSCKKGDIG